MGPCTVHPKWLVLVPLVLLAAVSVVELSVGAKTIRVMIAEEHAASLRDHRANGLDQYSRG